MEKFQDPQAGNFVQHSGAQKCYELYSKGTYEPKSGDFPL